MISEIAKTVAAKINIPKYSVEILLRLNIIERTPIIRKRYAIPESNRLIQVAAVKICGRARKDSADIISVGNRPTVK